MRKIINKPDYHDYVFKDEKFIGAFEKMYQNIEDPWNHGKANAIHYDIALFLLKCYKICRREGTILDIGCGKGAFTARLSKTLSKKIRIVGLDTSPTAIQKAKEDYVNLGIDFRVCNIINQYKKLPFRHNSIDLVVMSDLMWYVLPYCEKILEKMKDYIKKEGFLLVNQTFYPPEKQKYGKEIVSCVEDMLKIVHFEVVDIVETNRFYNHHAIILMKNI
jgi:ubiquinone/menaquinone biosynthesis C-methylase UbiE